MEAKLGKSAGHTYAKLYKMNTHLLSSLHIPHKAPATRLKMGMISLTSRLSSTVANNQP